MFRTCGCLVLTLLFCAGIQAATPTNTNITIEAIEGPQNGTPTSITIAGSARFNPGIPDVTGAFSANFSIASATATTGFGELHHPDVRGQADRHDNVADGLPVGRDRNGQRFRHHNRRHRHHL